MGLGPLSARIRPDGAAQLLGEGVVDPLGVPLREQGRQHHHPTATTLRITQSRSRPAMTRLQKPTTSAPAVMTTSGATRQNAEYTVVRVFRGLPAGPAGGVSNQRSTFFVVQGRYRHVTRGYNS